MRYILLALFLFIPSLAIADTLYLKNGFTLKVNIVEEAEDGVWVEEEPGSKIFWSHSDIKKIDRSKPAQKGSGLRVEEKIEQITDEQRARLLKEGEEKQAVKKKALQEKYEREVAQTKKIREKQNAIREQRVLVGMSADEVTKSVGAPYKKEGDKEKSTWIYGYTEKKRTPKSQVRRYYTDKSYVVNVPVYETYFTETLRVYFYREKVVRTENTEKKYLIQEEQGQ
jgi:hypothetical protein